jgi:hypothetical protein
MPQQAMRVVEIIATPRKQLLALFHKQFRNPDPEK